MVVDKNFIKILAAEPLARDTMRAEGIKPTARTKQTNIFFVLLYLLVVCYTGCITTTQTEMAPNIIPEYSILKIVPGTIITDYDGLQLPHAWKGRSWRYKEAVAIKISSGKHILRAEAEFDPPIWSYPQNIPYKFGKNPKIYVVDKTLNSPYGDPIDDTKKYLVYKGYLTTEFNFEPKHEYIAQVILDQDDDFILYIFDSNKYPYREESKFLPPSTTKDKFLESKNTPNKDTNKSR
ncbi:MAG: hypothetical protein Ta2B_22660 [Termitinemataceae bacterium]|nr:MAG: hypothetical protein Ta2B_22660 [Termitinemataceae bacterium]